MLKIIFEGFIYEATFTLSRRGHLKLVHDEYEYTKVRYSTSTGVTTWRCALPHSFPQFKCDVKAFTQQTGSSHMAKIIGEHTHSPGKQLELRQRKKTATNEFPPFKLV